MEMKIMDIAHNLNCAFHGDGEIMISGIAIDSREIQPGDLFVAVKGAKVDGHHYLKAALEKGAAAVAISDLSKIELNHLKNYIVIPEAIAFIQNLAAYIRMQLDYPVIAITGSSGKTTTKDILKSIIETQASVIATEANQNNELGLPLTICKVKSDTQALVVEMGMRGLQQIDFLCQIAKPTFGIITNIGMVHSELLGSQEKIAQAKAEMIPYIATQGAIALNISDYQLLLPWVQDCKGTVVWYSLEKGKGDVWIENFVSFPGGSKFDLFWQEEKHAVVLNLEGKHNVNNSLAAIIIARKIGIPWDVILRALVHVKISQMRMEERCNKHNISVINDAYNANPDSMKAALEVLVQKKNKRKIAVLGDMYELGQYEYQGHWSVGKYVCELEIDYLVAVGKLGKIIGESVEDNNAKNTRVYFANSNIEAIKIIKAIMSPHDIVLVKGSRGMKMEEIVEGIMG